ncbi:MAG: hypothetical protein U0670_08230 [Anaerolineae bacterium]
MAGSLLDTQLAKSPRVAQILEHLRTPLYRNGYALIVSTGITSLLGLLYWAVAARLYTPENVGLNSSAISIMIFLSGIAQINLQETMIRFIPQSGTRTLRLIASAYGMVILLSAIVALVFCAGIPLWAPSLSFLVASPALIGWFTAALILWGVFVIEDSVLIGLRQTLWVPLENAVFSVLKIGLLVLIAGSFTETGIFISWTVSVLVVIIPINLLIFKRLIPRHIAQTAPRPQQETIPLRQLWRYIAGNYAAALLSSMSSALLPIVITQTAGAEANAHFYLAWIIAGALQIVTANMATSLTVEAASDQANVHLYQRRALIGIARLVIPMTVAVFLSAPLILDLLGESYADEGSLLLRLLALAALPNIYNMVRAALARIRGSMGTVIGIYGSNAIMVLGLSILLMPHIGITGVGLAWMISQTLIAAVLLFQSVFKRRVIRASNPKERLS